MRTARFLVIALACSLLCPRSDGAVWFVNINATGANTGTSWANAFTNLQVAMAGVPVGDEIWVAAGTYKTATPGSPNARSLSFVMRNGVRVLGGFAGTESVVHQRNPRLNVCVLSGDINGDDTPNFGNRADNATNVVSAGNAGAGALLDGFVIRGGNANLVGSSVSGGGVQIAGGAPTISNCIIRDNEASVGAGVHSAASSANLSGLVVVGNRANSVSALNIESTGSVSIRHCTIAGNTSASASQPAVRVLNTTGGTLRGCVLWGNSNASGQGQAAQITVTTSGSFSVIDCDVQGGTAGLGSGCFSADPLFVSILGADGIPSSGDEDVRLRPGSPCIDRLGFGGLPPDTSDQDGDGNLTEIAPLDLRWSPRQVNDPATPNLAAPAIDVGAYEFQGTSCAGDMDGNGVVNTSDLTRFLGAFGNSGEALIPGDFNGDGVVNTADLILLLARFASACV